MTEQAAPAGARRDRAAACAEVFAGDAGRLNTASHGAPKAHWRPLRAGPNSSEGETKESRGKSTPSAPHRV